MMAKNKDASSFFNHENNDEEFFNNSLNGFSPLGKIFDIVKDDKDKTEIQENNPAKSAPVTQNKRPSAREGGMSPALSELDAKQKILDARVNKLIEELDEKNRQIAALEYKLAQQINKTYPHAKSSDSLDQSYSELHKKEILDNILQDIKGLYSSVSTRAKVVEDREYQILLKMVELDERQRALADKHQRRRNAYGLERVSPYEELAQQKLLPTDNPSLSKKINRSIDKIEHQIKTPHIAMAENINEIKPAIMAAPEIEKTDKPSEYVSSKRVQSLRQALAKETEGLEIFEENKTARQPVPETERRDAVRRSVSEKQLEVTHPSKEIQHEFNQAKLALQKRQLEQLQKQNGTQPNNIEMDSLLDEINQVLGEQKIIENQISDVLKSDGAQPKAPAQQPEKVVQAPAEIISTAPKTQEMVKSDTVDLEKDELSLLSSLLDDL